MHDSSSKQRCVQGGGFIACLTPVGTEDTPSGCQQQPATVSTDDPTDATANTPAPACINAIGLAAEVSGTTASTDADPRPDQSPPLAAAEPYDHVNNTPKGIPQLADTPSTAATSAPSLSAAGREDDAPTPALLTTHARRAVAVATGVNTPGTPADAPLRPFTFAVSAGSSFATPEVRIASQMTPMTAAEARQAQKHLPAWHRAERVVHKQVCSVFVASLLTMCT
jgi:hypothetical protein